MDTQIIGAIKIKDGLFIGDQYSAEDLEFIVANKVTHIINCAGLDVPNIWQSIGVAYLTFNWQENDSQVLFDSKDENLNAIYNFVEEAHEMGESCLVHSLRGQSRSCCVLAAFIMRKYRWTLYKTLEYLNSRRPDLEIRASFFHQMTNLEIRLAKLGLGAKSSNWNEIEDEKTIYENEELLIRNTFLNSKNLPGVPEHILNQDNNNKYRNPNRIRLNWVDESTSEGNLASYFDESSAVKPKKGKIPLRSILKGLQKKFPQKTETVSSKKPNSLVHSLRPNKSTNCLLEEAQTVQNISQVAPSQQVNSSYGKSSSGLLRSSSMNNLDKEENANMIAQAQEKKGNIQVAINNYMSPNSNQLMMMSSSFSNRNKPNDRSNIPRPTSSSSTKHESTNSFGRSDLSKSPISGNSSKSMIPQPQKTFSTALSTNIGNSGSTQHNFRSTSLPKKMEQDSNNLSYLNDASNRLNVYSFDQKQTGNKSNNNSFIDPEAIEKRNGTSKAETPSVSPKPSKRSESPSMRPKDSCLNVNMETNAEKNGGYSRIKTSSSQSSSSNPPKKEDQVNSYLSSSGALSKIQSKLLNSFSQTQEKPYVPYSGLALSAQNKENRIVYNASDLNEQQEPANKNTGFSYSVKPNISSNQSNSYGNPLQLNQNLNNLMKSVLNYQYTSKQGQNNSSSSSSANTSKLGPIRATYEVVENMDRSMYTKKDNIQDLSDRNNMYEQIQKSSASSGQERKTPIGITPENPFNRTGSAPQRYYSPSAKNLQSKNPKSQFSNNNGMIHQATSYLTNNSSTSANSGSYLSQGRSRLRSSSPSQNGNHQGNSSNIINASSNNNLSQKSMLLASSITSKPKWKI